MQFKGQLLLPDEPGPGLRVNLDVAEHHLAVESDDGGLGAWPLEVVGVKRLQGDVFALTVAGESLRFVADDTISFAYSALPTIEQGGRKHWSRSTFRSVLDRIWNGPDEATPPVVSESTVDEAPLHEESAADEPLPLMARIDQAFDELEIPATTPLIESDDGIVTQEEPLEPRQVEMATVFPVDTSLLSPVREDPGEDLADAAGCPAVRSDGRRCESPILTSSGYCYPHDPKRAFEDRYQAAQEARAQLKRDSTDRLNRIYGRLDKAMRQVERGELDPETAMAMAQIASTMCAILNMEEPPSGDRL